jgi:phosphatidate cytidylyltransferase
MLRTRLWMGSVLVTLVAGVLLIDQKLGPWFPFLLALVAGLTVAATFELLRLLPANIRPPAGVCYAGGAALVAANWLPHWVAGDVSAWPAVSGTLAAAVMVVFVAEMAAFREPGRSVMRAALAIWLFAYVGLLPSFLAQLRWEGPTLAHSTAALTLAIFVPKCCDIGAYFTGRLIGRHRMTPVLSPKKTWEGAAGGLIAAVVVSALLDRLGPAQVLRGNLAIEAGFGLTVGMAGMLGDLAESLVKRDFQHKDASQALPGYGGVLDVVDAILFAAPVASAWFAWLSFLVNDNT